MSLSIVVLVVVGYLAMVLLVVALMRTGSRADISTEREHEEFLRATSARPSGRFAEREEPAREHATLRRSG